jgi:hypothetical protein
VTVTTTQQQPRHPGTPRVGTHSPAGSHAPTVFRVDLNPNAPRPPALSPLGAHPLAGTPGGPSQQWGSSATTPLGSSASSGPTPGSFSHSGFPQGPSQAGPSGGVGGYWAPQTPTSYGPPPTWPTGGETGDGAGRQAGPPEGVQGLYSPLSPYGAASPRDFKPPRGGPSLRVRGRGRGRGRSRRGGEESGIFGSALTPGEECPDDGQLWAALDCSCLCPSWYFSCKCGASIRAKACQME